jgi:hypothetical protein
MWNVAVLAILMSVAGVYAVRNAQSLETAHDNLTASTAADMAIYRSAVIDYFSANPGAVSTSVDTAALKAPVAYLPTWSRMSQQSEPLIWKNYRDANGVIYVYATQMPGQNLTAELAQLAHNSVLFGIYRGTGMYSAAGGNSGISLAAIPKGTIKEGAPVWLAMNK